MFLFWIALSHLSSLRGSRRNQSIVHKFTVCGFADFTQIKAIYRNDDNIFFSIAGSCARDIVCNIDYYEAAALDRHCLLPPPIPPEGRVISYNGSCEDTSSMLKFINNHSKLHRTLTGSNSDVGNLVNKASKNTYMIENSSVDTCDRISYNQLNVSHFAEQYWLRQKPLIIENFYAEAEFQLLQENIIELLLPFWKQKVDAKFSPNSDFEGIDKLSNWAMGSRQHVPQEVLKQLESPHLVVVRAAHESTTLGRRLFIL